MSRQKFSRALKRQIAIEYMQSGKSRQEIALKYGLPNVNTLSSWGYAALIRVVNIIALSPLYLMAERNSCRCCSI